jgi:hypothetical protein
MIIFQRGLTMMYNTQNYWVFGRFHHPVFWKTENTTFRKLDLFPSWGDWGGRHIFSWFP